MSEDSMWHDYDTVLPSGKCKRREKVHMADLPSCERMFPKKKIITNFHLEKEVCEQGFYFIR